jgi:predicted hydrocarbon binding protein
MSVSLSKKKGKKGNSGAGRELVMNEQQGTLSAYGARFLLIPVKLIHSIEDRLTESFGPVTATSFQYEIGREGGAQYIHLAQKAGFSLKSPNDIQKIASSLGTLDGWGKLQIVDFDPAKKFARIRWKNGVSVRNRKGKTPVCHFGRGILTGAVGEIFATRLESIEVSCQGKGDSFCEAIIGEPREISRLADTRP